jgi:hypothetical protein
MTCYLRVVEPEGFVLPSNMLDFQYLMWTLILYSPNYSPLLICFGIAANAIYKDNKYYTVIAF